MTSKSANFFENLFSDQRISIAKAVIPNRKTMIFEVKP